MHWLPAVLQRCGYAPHKVNFQRVRQQVENDLLPHLAIGVHGLRRMAAIDDETQSCALHRRAEVGGKIFGQRSKIHRLERCLHAAGFDAREIQQTVDEFLQPQSVPVYEFEQLATLAPRAFRRCREKFFHRTQHQGERRAQFMADVREEGGLGTVDLGKCFSAAAFRFPRARVAQRGCYLTGEQIDEAAVPGVETPVRIDARDEEPGWALITLLPDWNHDGFVRRSFPIPQRWRHVRQESEGYVTKIPEAARTNTLCAGHGESRPLSMSGCARGCSGGMPLEPARRAADSSRPSNR